jgi:hypothetical protein
MRHGPLDKNGMFLYTTKWLVAKHLLDKKKEKGEISTANLVY